jgi:hypothetical protein
MRRKKTDPVLFSKGGVDFLTLFIDPKGLTSSIPARTMSVPALQLQPFAQDPPRYSARNVANRLAEAAKQLTPPAS